MNDIAAPALVRQLVIFTLDIEKYAVPITEVREVVKAPEITPVPGSPEFIVGVVNLRGNIIPVLDIEKLFHLERKTAHPSVVLLLIIEHTDGSLFGVLVDKVAKITKVSDENIQPAPAMVTARIAADYVDGVVVTEDHAAGVQTAADVILLLSLHNIITKEVVQAVAAAADDAAKEPDNQEQPKEEHAS